MSEARRITLALDGRWSNGHGSAFCPAHANHRTPALSLADGETGKVLLFCFAGCSFSQIAAALRVRGLAAGGAVDTRDVTRLLASAEVAPARKDSLKNAMRLWWMGRPVEGTLVEAYLDRRGLGLPFVTDALRFDPKCWHSAEIGYLPAMLARVERAGEIVGVQRTYLRPPGDKASVDTPRKTLGRTRGGAVKLSDSCGSLIVAEGVETALAFDTEYSRVWATLGAAGMAGLELPVVDVETFNSLMIAADGDDAGRRAADALAARAKATGWDVLIVTAPTGLDWADVALAHKEASLNGRDPT